MFINERERNSIILLEDPQASPTLPSDRRSVKMKMLEWLEVAAWEGGRGILIYWINFELYNLEKYIFDGFGTKGLHLDKFKSAGLHEIRAIATWNLGTIFGELQTCLTWWPCPLPVFQTEYKQNKAVVFCPDTKNRS
jgi:hypothetical protein